MSLECYGCHSANFTSVNPLQPEKADGYLGGGNKLALEGSKSIYSANLTADVETGIGSWTEADFIRAVKKGFRPDGRVLHYPMEPKPELTDDEAAAIYAYLRTVPKIKNAVLRPTATPPASIAANDQGRGIYDRYGCVSCHGETGKGMVGDLRHANETYRTDAELRLWIDEAPSLKPGTKMPGWKGIIKEEDYPALLSYVRTLSAKSEQNGRTSMND